MDVRSLGRTGLKVTELCLGTMTFGKQANKQTSFSIMDKAIEAGINFFDTADVYPLGRDSYKLAGATESIIGEWLPGKRDKVVLASKCFGVMGPGPNDRGLGRKHILQALEDSLQRLGTDYLDLYMAHQIDPETPLEETMHAFDTLVQQGKVRYIGISNWRAWQVAKANGIAALKGYAPIVSVEPRYNLLFRMIEEDLVPMAINEGIGIISYNPLAGGLLTGRHQGEEAPQENTRFSLPAAGEVYRKRYWQDANFRAVDRYIAWCREQQLDPTTTAVRWVLQQPGISSVIIGASRAEQLDASLAAPHVDPLTEEQLRWLDKIWFELPRSYEFS